MRDHNKVLELYNKGYNTVQIGKELNCDNSTVGRILRKNGIIPKGNKRVRSKLEDTMICDLYKYGYTAKEIGDMFSYTDGGISRILKKYGIEKRKAVRRSVISNHDYFENIDTEEKAYFLGLLIADGAITLRKRNDNTAPTISLELNKEDVYLVEKFKEVLGGTMKVQLTSKDCYKISFSSQKMADDLAKYGVVQAKSDKTYIPKIDDSLMRHLIRGIFDGDGTVYIYNGKNGQDLRVGFYGTNKLCSQIKEIFGWTTSVFDKENVSFIVTAKADDVCKFYSEIYKDATIYMKRKKDKFDNWLC